MTLEEVFRMSYDPFTGFTGLAFAENQGLIFAWYPRDELRTINLVYNCYSWLSLDLFKCTDDPHCSSWYGWKVILLNWYFSKLFPTFRFVNIYFSIFFFFFVWFFSWRKRGAIINLSSSASQHPSPLVTVYSATKVTLCYCTL